MFLSWLGIVCRCHKLRVRVRSRSTNETQGVLFVMLAALERHHVREAVADP